MPKSFLDLINDAQRGGTAVVFSDVQAAALARGVWPKDGTLNASVASQAIGAASRTYITGSALAIPSPLQVSATS
jgi:hypothetical protein